MKKKILLLYPYYWPLYKAGGPVQSLFNIAKTLGDAADFYLISRDRDIDGHPAPQPIVTGIWMNGLNDEKVLYFKQIYPWLVFRIIKTLAPDVVLINGIFNVSTTIPGIFACKRRNTRMIISPRGMLQSWGLQRGVIKKFFFLQLLKQVLNKNEEWHATDLQEQTDIRKIFGDEQNVHVASNIPRQVSPLTLIPFPNDDKKIELVFLSLINPNKNLHLVIDAVKKNPKISLAIYGPVANQSYWKLCQQKMEGVQTIKYHGPVPPWDVTELLRNYHFLVLPTDGENFGHAIFDALAASVPVVISRKTPWTSIDTAGAGMYVSTENENELDTILSKIAKLSEYDYQNFRRAANNYALEYWNARNYKSDYQFLLNS